MFSTTSIDFIDARRLAPKMFEVPIFHHPTALFHANDAEGCRLSRRW